MNLAKISANGQITVPADIRKYLGVEPGDKILFVPKGNGEVMISNAESVLQTPSKELSSKAKRSEKMPVEEEPVRESKQAVELLRNKYGL